MHLSGIDATLHDVLMLVGRGVFSSASSMDRVLCADARSYEWTLNPGPHVALVEVDCAHPSLPIPFDMPTEFRRRRISLNIDHPLTRFFTLVDLECLRLWEVDVTDAASTALRIQAPHYMALRSLLPRLARMSQAELNRRLSLQLHTVGRTSPTGRVPLFGLMYGAIGDFTPDDVLYPTSTPSSPTRAMKQLDEMTMEEIDCYLDEHLTLDESSDEGGG